MFYLLLIDDDRLFTQGLKLLLDALKSDIHFLEADKVETAVAEHAQMKPELIIVDYFFRNSSIHGIEGVKTIKGQFPDSSVVVCSGADISTDSAVGVNLDDLRQAGASGFIPKSANQNTLINALTLILDGEEFFPASMLAKSINVKSTSTTSALLDRLTPRQLEILNLAAQGVQNKLIADQLHLAEGTVKAHLSSIYQLLGVDNRTQAANLLKHQH